MSETGSQPVIQLTPPMTPVKELQPMAVGKKRKVLESPDNDDVQNVKSLHNTKRMAAMTAKKAKKNTPVSSRRKTTPKKRLFTTPEPVKAPGEMSCDDKDKDDLGCSPISPEPIHAESLVKAEVDSGCDEDEASQFPCAQELLDEITPPELMRSSSPVNSDVSHECTDACTDAMISIHHLANERCRREAFANTVMERIWTTKYTIPNSTGKNLAIFDMCENALSFTTKVLTRNDKAYKINISPGRYLDFEPGRKIEIAIEDLMIAYDKINDVLTQRLVNPNIDTQTVVVGHADKLTIECTSANSELKLTLSPPNDVKILSRDIYKRSTPLHFRAREDVSVTIINSEIARFMLSLNEAMTFCNFLDIIHHQRRETYSKLKDRYSSDPSRYPPQVYYEMVVTSFHSLKTEPDYTLPIQVVLPDFMAEHFGTSYEMDF